MRNSGEFFVWAPMPYQRRDRSVEEPPLFFGLLEDMARAVPEIAELLAPIVHEDAELIDAEMEVGWARTVLNNKRIPRAASQANNALVSALQRIADTPAKTKRGEAIKERHCAPKR
jgi:hypothetical protein